MNEKMELAGGLRGDYSLNQTLGALGLSKGTYYYRRHLRPLRQDEDAALKERIVSVTEENPSCGYRRIHAELPKSDSEPVNHKRIRRVLGDYELRLRRCRPKSKPSTAASLITQVGVSADLVKDRTPKALEAFSADYTELLYDGGHKKAWLMVLLDIESE